MVGTSRKVRVGLSPRVRGNRVASRQVTARARSIPASAGEPERADGFEEIEGVYPRECGGTMGAADVTSPRQGLSPRVRGNPNREIIALIDHGSIPASAGEPARQMARASEARVYPRECGGTPTREAPRR